MISSMTGYARVQSELSWGTLTWEIRSVNHRYLETGFRLPESFRFLEIKWKQLISKSVSRGKVDVSLKFQPAAGHSDDTVINEDLVSQLSRFSNTLSSAFPNPQTQIMDVLNWPGVLKTTEADRDELAGAATDGLQAALQQLVETRQTEGASLLGFFESHLDTMSGYVRQVQTALPDVLHVANDRMRSRFSELKLEIDQARLEQELVWLAQKVDVAEEIKRLDVHINEFGDILKKGGVIGRRLDFLAQELNREANTLASKSIDATVTHLAVELKVLIEQIREQVQNIE